MMSQLAMLHRSVKWTQKICIDHESWSDQHTAERLVVRGFWDLWLLETQLKKYDEMIVTIGEKLFNAKENNAR